MSLAGIFKTVTAPVEPQSVASADLSLPKAVAVVVLSLWKDAFADA